MAFCDNPKFLLSHIHHSFITCDDTGMCEIVMLNETIPHRLPNDPDSILLESYEVETKSELFDGAQSYDVVSDIGAHRRRSNTAQKLEQLKREKKYRAKIKMISWKDNHQDLNNEDLSKLFPCKPLNKIKDSRQKKSALSVQLEQCPAIPTNPFNEFARFDGRVSEGSRSRIYKIFLTMLPPEVKDRSMQVVALFIARVQDLIGLICWLYTNEEREPKLKSNVSNYCLRIAEENGEIDLDFPSLNPKEPIDKFGFPTLALVEAEEGHSNNTNEASNLFSILGGIDIPVHMQLSSNENSQQSNSDHKKGHKHISFSIFKKWSKRKGDHQKGKKLLS